MNKMRDEHEHSKYLLYYGHPEAGVLNQYWKKQSALLKPILFCAKQHIALCNQYIVKNNDISKSQLDYPAMENATYIPQAHMNCWKY